MKLSIRQKTILILSIGAVMHIAFTVALYFNHKPLIDTAGDAPSYIQTAKNFIEKGVWSSVADNNPKPDNFRVPLYPLFLSFFLYFGIPLWVIGIIQSIVMMGLSVAIYRLGARLFSDAVSFFAALVFSIEPYIVSSYITRAVMTEAFAVTFFTVALLLLGLFLRGQQPRYLWWSAAGFAFASLTKPQLFPFGILLLASVLLINRNVVSWRSSLITFGIFGVFVSPWIAYNLFALHTFQYSSITGPAYFFDSTHRFMMWKTNGQDPNYNRPYWERAREILGTGPDANELFSPHSAEILGDVAQETLRRYPFSYAYYHLIHVPRLFYHDFNLEAFTDDFGIDLNLQGGEMDINVIKYVVRGNLSAAWNQITLHPFWIISLFLKTTFFLFGILAIGNCIIRWWVTGEKSQFAILMGIFLLLYGIGVSPFGQQRYRVPIEPLILLLAGDSMYLFSVKIKNTPNLNG